MALIRQGLWFVLVGGVQVLADWAAFVGLSALGVPIAGANIAARAGGASLGFWLNGRITFADGGQQRLGGRRFLLQLRKVLVLCGISTPEEDAAEETRAESPMCSHGGENGIGHCRLGNGRTMGIRAVQHQSLDALRKCGGECDCGAASARAGEERHPLKPELVEKRTQHSDFAVERQI